MTVIPLSDGGVRLVSSRDELRTRAPASLPSVRTLRAGISAAWPTDADAGGTWVAASSRGLCLSLLNVNLRAMPSAHPEGVSRGMLIPSLIDSPGPAGVMERLARSSLERFKPFRMIAADATMIAEFRWDGASPAVREWELSPMCFASSGLGDERVAERVDWWRDWVRARGVSSSSQDAFHRHRWADRPEVSVWMERADARTVSVTSGRADGQGNVEVVYRSADDPREHRVRVASVVVTRSATFVSRPPGGRV